MRPQTYENADELEILGYVFSGHGGVQNTSFAILDPEGKIPEGSRSPSMTYGSALARRGESRRKPAGRYRDGAKPMAALPVVRDLRLGLRRRRTDLRPLVGRGEDAAGPRAPRGRGGEGRVVEGPGRDLHYVVLEAETTFGGLTPDVGVTVVQPDPYGQGGEVLAHVGRGAKLAALAAGIASGVEAHDVAIREYRAHVREARRRGISWGTATPVSDDHGRRGGGEGRRRRRR